MEGRAMTATVIKSDAQIKQDVLNELKWDTRVDETDIGVEVDGGVVTLTGTVDSWGKRIAAQEAAHRVYGLLDVANDVKVKRLGDRDDTDIAQAVRRALEWDVFVPHDRIRSTVSDGSVTLSGDVDYWMQREDAERTVRNLLGVRNVIDNIAVKAPRVASAEVRKAIQNALERQADREARQIDVTVSEGRVSVSGPVHSWAERAAVLGAVRGTRGVMEVDDHVRVERWT
jgi:osmotically-inducible protein OsmY